MSDKGWEYRVFVERTEGDELYCVQEVYTGYAASGRLGYSDPQPAMGDTLDDLEQDLLRQLEAVRAVKEGKKKLMQDINFEAVEVEKS